MKREKTTEIFQMDESFNILKIKIKVFYEILYFV